MDKKRVGPAFTESHRNKLEGMLSTKTQSTKDTREQNTLGPKTQVPKDTKTQGNKGPKTQRHKALKKRGVFYVPPETMKALRVMSAETERTMSELIEESLELLFTKHNRKGA